MRSFVLNLVPFFNGHLNTSFTFVPTIANHTTHKNQMQAKFSTFFNYTFCTPPSAIESVAVPLCQYASRALNRKIPHALPLEDGYGTANDTGAWLQYNPYLENP